MTKAQEVYLCKDFTCSYCGHSESILTIDEINYMNEIVYYFTECGSCKKPRCRLASNLRLFENWLKDGMLIPFGIKTKKVCVCGAKKTSNPNCHADWCDVK